MVNVSATRMDTVATVSLDTQAPNVNMTLMNVNQTMPMRNCENIPGSYQCSCHPGYKLDTLRCFVVNVLIKTQGSKWFKQNECQYFPYDYLNGLLRPFMLSRLVRFCLVRTFF